MREQGYGYEFSGEIYFFSFIQHQGSGLAMSLMDLGSGAAERLTLTRSYTDNRALWSPSFMEWRNLFQTSLLDRFQDYVSGAPFPLIL